MGILPFCVYDQVVTGFVLVCKIESTKPLPVHRVGFLPHMSTLMFGNVDVMLFLVLSFPNMIIRCLCTYDHRLIAWSQEIFRYYRKVDYQSDAR